MFIYNTVNVEVCHQPLTEVVHLMLY